MSFGIAGVRRAANETGESAAQVQAASTEVARQGGKLKTDIERFLYCIRAA